MPKKAGTSKKKSPVKEKPSAKVKNESKKASKSSIKPEPKKKTKIEEPEQADQESEIEEVYVAPTPKPKKTGRYMSTFEYCALINARAVQLGTTAENGPRVPIENPEDYDPLLIATREVHANLVSLIIRRVFPDGTSEDWDPKDMILPRI